MKVLVLGASGQLGSAFKNEIFSNFKLYLISKQNIKLNNFIVMYKKIKAIKPQVIINFLAFTDVDFAFRLARAIASLINLSIF